MADSQQQKIIDSQAREIEKLKAARRVPNTAAADMASVLDSSNAALQSNKSDLESKNAALKRDLSAAIQERANISQRNIFVEAELQAARRLFQQAVPGEHDDLRQQIAMLVGKASALQHERFIREQENMVLHRRIQVLEADRKNLLADNTAVRNICVQWDRYSAKQAADIEGLKRQAQHLHESMVRKGWRLQVQKQYLDKAGLIVEEFKTKDDLAARDWAVEVLEKPKSGGGTTAESETAENETAKKVGTETEEADGTSMEIEESGDEKVMCAADNGEQASEEDDC